MADLSVHRKMSAPHANAALCGVHSYECDENQVPADGTAVRVVNMAALAR